MTEFFIFGAGSIVFISVTWAAIAFGVQRMHELEVAELEQSDRTAVEQQSGLTELHLPEGHESDESAGGRPGGRTSGTRSAPNST